MGHDKSHNHDGLDGSGTVEGTSIKSTGEGAGIKVLTEDGSGGASWSPHPGGVDTTAIHKITADEINQMVAKSPLADDDIVVIEDSAATWGKKKSLLSTIKTYVLNALSHASLTGVTSDQHHAKSHNHDTASGAGAIATDQIAKFGDGGVTNYAELQTSGKYRAYGTGRWKRTYYTLAPTMAVGGSLSFNGNTYAACLYTLLSATDRPALFRGFDWSNPLKRTYVIAQVVLPADYVAGTDFQVCIAWCAAETTGNVVWTVGRLGVSDGDSYNTTPTYTSLSAAAVSGTAYGRVTTTLTVTGTGYSPGDCIPMVLLRVAGSGSDTLQSTAYVAGMGITYTADKLGADV